MKRLLILCSATLLTLAGCSKPKSESSGGLPAVTLQTDWYAQAEHGGYYQAMAKGYYREEGIDVSIRVGGPSINPGQLVAMEQIEFAMGRSDDAIVSIGRGLPLLIVTALMQRDPQAILLHDENPVRSFADLNGRSIMAVPGANWIAYLKARHGITFGIIPLNYGLANFMADKGFMQQCFVTNEPFYVREQGANPRTLLIADSGYNPYRVIITSKAFAAQHPERVRAFVAASIRGWDSFLTGDASPGKAVIASRNEKMSDAFMSFSISEMNRLKLVSGDPALGEATGLLTRRRIQEQLDLLLELKLLDRALPIEEVVSFDFLPPALREAALKN